MFAELLSKRIRMGAGIAEDLELRAVMPGERGQEGTADDMVTKVGRDEADAQLASGGRRVGVRRRRRDMAPVPFCVLLRDRPVGRGGIIVHDQDQIAADLLCVGLEFDAAAE